MKSTLTTNSKRLLERYFAAALKLAERFPGIESDTCYGTPAIRVKGKFMARLRTEAEGWLAIKCDFIDREILLQSAPHIFHLTPHYQNYPMILVDLAAIDKEALLEVLERAWRRTASKTAIREFDEGHIRAAAKTAAAKTAPTKERPAKKRAAKKR